MHMLQSLFYLTTALHVSGVIITHLQEHRTIVTTASGNRYTVLLSAAIVEDLDQINSVICASCWDLYIRRVQIFLCTSYLIHAAESFLRS